MTQLLPSQTRVSHILQCCKGLIILLSSIYKQVRKVSKLGDEGKITDAVEEKLWWFRLPLKS